VLGENIPLYAHAQTSHPGGWPQPSSPATPVTCAIHVRTATRKWSPKSGQKMELAARIKGGREGRAKRSVGGARRPLIARQGWRRPEGSTGSTRSSSHTGFTRRRSCSGRTRCWSRRRRYSRRSAGQSRNAVRARLIGCRCPSRSPDFPPDPLVTEDAARPSELLPLLRLVWVGPRSGSVPSGERPVAVAPQAFSGRSGAIAAQCGESLNEWGQAGGNSTR
jgi:hypothetical protein